MGPKSDSFLIDLWIGASLSRPDGNLVGWSEQDIADEAGFEEDPHKLVNALCDCGWLQKDRQNGHYVIHDWKDHQGWCLGTENRTSKSRIAALIKNHGRKKGLRIAAEQYGINPLDYGYSDYEPEEDSASSMPVACQRHADRQAEKDATGMPQAAAPSPSPLPSPLPSPKDKSTSDEVDSGPAQKACPHTAIIAAYHEHCPVLPQVKVWGKTPRSYLTTRWREDRARQSIGFWEEFFKFISKSKFLMGENDRGWLPDLAWIVKESNFAKIINGRFHSNQKAKNLEAYQKFLRGGDT